MKEWINQYYNGSGIVAQTSAFSIFQNPGEKKNEKYGEIISMLNNDIPVLFSIGIGYWDSSPKKVFFYELDNEGVDNLTGQRWMKVQTWGKYRLINFDEWIENQKDTSWDLVMKIVKNY